MQMIFIDYRDESVFFPSLAMPVQYIHTYDMCSLLLASCFLPLVSYFLLLASFFLLLCEARRRPGAECRRLHFAEVDSNKSLGRFVCGCVCVWTVVCPRQGLLVDTGKFTQLASSLQVVYIIPCTLYQTNNVYTARYK